jgi:Tfp pilus assembly protein PilN
MLTVNLLPASVRKTKLTSVEQFHRTPIMALAVGIMVALPLFFLVPVQMFQQQSRGLRTKIQALEPRRAEVERLQRLLQELRNQHAAFQSMQKGEGSWAGRLNTLSRVVPEGVWFTDLNLDQTKGLIIQGTAIEQLDPEMTNVSRLVRALEANSDFSSAVKGIQIESIKRVMDGEVEVVQFTLVCALAESATR